MKYSCPCCGYLTLTEPPPGTFQLCAVCFWEDDAVQFEDPDETVGANGVSLRIAQTNFAEFGASERQFAAQVRAPLADEVASVRVVARTTKA